MFELHIYPISTITYNERRLNDFFILFKEFRYPPIFSFPAYAWKWDEKKSGWTITKD